MATLSQPAKEEVCAEKKKLSDLMLAAANAVFALEAQERPLINHGGTVALLRIAQRLRAKRAEWESARKAFQAHIREHRC